MRLIDADALLEHKFVSINCYLKSNDDNGYSRYKQGWNDAIDAIIYNAPTVLADNYSMGYQDGVREVLSERPTGEWIPVSERLPDVAKKCIVQLTDGHITIGSYHSIDKWIFQETSISYTYPKETVIAWMPLPEAYKEEAENE